MGYTQSGVIIAVASWEIMALNSGSSIAIFDYWRVYLSCLGDFEDDFQVFVGDEIHIYLSCWVLWTKKDMWYYLSWRYHSPPYMYQPLINGDLNLSSFFVTGMMRIGFGESSINYKFQWFGKRFGESEIHSSWFGESSNISTNFKVSELWSFSQLFGDITKRHGHVLRETWDLQEHTGTNGWFVLFLWGLISGHDDDYHNIHTQI